jgi:DNA-binding transcriptional MocR family regulator
MAREARARALAYVPGAVFFTEGGGQDAMRLAFSRIDDALIEEGARRLGRLIRDTRGGQSAKEEV